MPRHIAVFVSGWSKTGKDTSLEHLVEHYDAVQIGLADPAKRYVMEVYGFTYDQVFGPSEMRNAGDSRLPKNVYIDYHGEKTSFDELAKIDMSFGKRTFVEWHHIDLDDDDVKKLKLENVVSKLDKRDVGAGFVRYYFASTDPNFFLSPREVLQMHCEQFNEFHINTWIRKGLDVQAKLREVMEENEVWALQWKYTKEKGLVPNNGTISEQGWKSKNVPLVTCSADFRHIHEYRMAREYHENQLGTVVLVRIKRPGIVKPPFNHRSETEQTMVRDEAFDFVVQNDGSLQDLKNRMDDIMFQVMSPGWKSKTWSNNYIARNHNFELGYLP